MKQWRKIIIFASILVVLVVALILNSVLGKGPEGQEQPTPTPTPGPDPVVEIEESEATKVTVENENGVFVFIPEVTKDEEDKEEIHWSIEDHGDLILDQSSIDSKVRGYLDISVSREIAADGADLEQYGLLSPSASISIKTSSGEDAVILFGDKVSGNSGYYVMKQESGRVCTVTEYTAENAFISILDFLSRDIYGGITQADMTGMLFTRKSDSLELNAVSNMDADEENQVPATWRITSPIEAEASMDGFQSFFAEVTALAPAEYIEISPEDLSAYGLDDPDYTFVFKTESSEIEILLGGGAGAGMIYGYSSYMDAVFEISGSSFSFIDKPFTELISSFVYMVSIWEVSDIDITIGAVQINCDIQDEQDSSSESDFKVNGLDANVEDSSGSSYFRQFYQSVISVFVEGVQPEADSEYDPEITIKFTDKEDSKVTELGFVKRDEYTYYCFIDGIYKGFYVSSDDFFGEKAGNEGILPAYELLMEAIENQVDGVYE